MKVWDLDTGQETFTLKGHDGAVVSVAWSADGRRLASSGADRTIRVWDADTGQETLTLTGHALPAYSVAFLADGRRLVSGSADGMVMVWDAGPVPAVGYSSLRRVLTGWEWAVLTGLPWLGMP
jgi:WD40 repeat protein